MQHYYFSRHAKINWLTLDQFAYLSSDDLLSGAFSINWANESPEIQAFRSKLEQLSDEDLHDSFVERISLRHEDRQKQRDEVAAGLFFNAPNAFANYERWARRLTWTIEQCIALSLGREPNVLTIANLHEAGDDAIRSDLGAAFLDRMEIAHNWISVGQLAPEATPGEYLAWLRNARLDHAPELVKAVEAFGNDIINWQERSAELQDDIFRLQAEKTRLIDQNREWAHAFDQLRTRSAAEIEALQAQVAQAELALKLTDGDGRPTEVEEDEVLDPRERTSLHKLVYAMATRKYYFDPDEDKWPAVAKIAGDLNLAGLSLSEKAVRGHLRKSAETAYKEKRK